MCCGDNFGTIFGEKFRAALGRDDDSFEVEDLVDFLQAHGVKKIGLKMIELAQRIEDN